MKLLIVGSTGSIGVHLVTQALEQGHTVTTFARTPAKLDSIKHPNLRVVQGDVLDSESLVKAVAGQDAVLCSLGAGREGHVRSEGTRNVIRAMEQTGVKRFICQTTLGAGDSRNTLNFFWKYIMFGLLLKKAYKDHELQERFIQQSHLDWTITRPAAFVDGNRTGQYKHGFFESGADLTLKISRADVADFMLKQLTNTTYFHKTPGQSY